VLKNGSRFLPDELQKYMLKPTSPPLNAGTGLTTISKARNPKGDPWALGSEVQLKQSWKVKEAKVKRHVG